MCAIVDANVSSQVFGDTLSPAGQHFLNWLTPSRGGKLILGGKLLEELSVLRTFPLWLRVARESGVAKIIPDDRVNAETTDLENQGVCQSNDAHVIALAMIGGARILFTNYLTLRRDFRRIIHGQIYDTRNSVNVTSSHWNLLRRPCPP